MLRARWPLYFLAAGLPAVLLWPALRAPGRLLAGDEGVDVWSHVWGISWFYDQISQGRWPWRVDGLAWPDGGVLWYIDPLGALLSLPFQAAFGPVVGYNAAVYLALALAALAGGLWGRALGGAGWVAAVALGTAPFLQGELHNGITEALWLGLAPLAGVAALRGSLWTGPIVGLAFFATPYHGINAALVAAGATAVSVEGGPGARARRLALAAVLAALVAAPSLAGLSLSLTDPAALARKPPGTVDNLPVFRVNAVDPVAFLRPGDFWSVRLDGPLEAPFRRTPYLGWVALVLAAIAVRGRRRLAWLLLPAAVGAVAALGPYLWRDGDFARGADGRPLALPFWAVLAWTGVSIDHPLRLAGATLTVLAGLADAALPARFGALRPEPALAVRWAPAAALAVALEQLLVAPNCWPAPVADARVPAVYDLLPADGRALIDLPADRGDSLATNRYLYWQAHHGRGIPYASKVGHQGFPSDNAALRAWAALGRLDEPAPPPADLRDAVSALAAQGYGWVVLHPSLLARVELEERHRDALDPVLGRPRSMGGALVWQIPPR